MADKDVEIKIGTTADTSGAEKAAEAIKEIREAAANPMSMPDHIMGRQEELERQVAATKELVQETKDLAEIEEEARQKQREADVEKAKALKKQREEAEEARKALDEVTTLQRVQVAQQFAEGLGRAAAATRSLAGELQLAGVKGSGLVSGLATGMESVSGAVSGAAAGFATGGPLGAAIGGMVGLLTGPLNNAITGTVNDLKALKTAEDDAATAAKTLKAAHDAVNTERQRNSLFEFFERGRQAITAAIAEYERFVKVRDATTSADASIRQTQANTALARGASPFQVGAAGTQADFNERISQLENEIADAKKRAELAENAAVQAELDAKSAAASGSTTQADVERLEGEAKNARAVADQAKDTADGAVKVAEQKLRAVIAEKDAQVEEAFFNIGDEAAERGKQILDLVNSASKQGESLTAAQKDAAQRLQQTLSDGAVAQEEQARFQADLKTIITSLGNQGKEAQEANKLFLQAITSMETNNRTFIEITRNMQRRQEQMETELRELREQSLNPTQPR